MFGLGDRARQLPLPGRPTTLESVGQGPAGWMGCFCFVFFVVVVVLFFFGHLVYHIFLL